MRVTVMHGAGDVRIEDVPDAKLVDPTDALIRVTGAMLIRIAAPRRSARPITRMRRLRR
jgi:hypothetical protein